MNKKQYAEFHKYLAMLIYEYNEMLYNSFLTEESKIDVTETLLALEKVQNICILERKDK